MSNAWTDRTIRGPEDDHVDATDFRKHFGGMSEETYDSLRASGVIPAPVTFSGKVKLHPWEHVVYFSLWLRFFGDAVKEKPSGK